jgi:hypothetical protein
VRRQGGSDHRRGARRLLPSRQPPLAAPVDGLDYSHSDDDDDDDDDDDEHRPAATRTAPR